MYPRLYGDYMLLERIATGGMSQIDLARKTVTGSDFVRFVVIKRIKADRNDDDAFVRMFKDEARITAELRHGNIAQVYDFGRHEDEYFLALEYVPGVDIRRIINTLRERHQRMPLKVVLKVAVDVLDALAYAHTRTDTLGKPMEIVHRDVNPRNIMVSVGGEVKLIDFGVARATNRLERTATDHVKGKLAYMAPEQVRGGKLDGRVDLFAVGLTIHEMITGYSPFAGLDQVAIVHRLANARVPDLPPPPEVADPRALHRMHRRSLQKDPSRRFADARAFRDAVLEVAEEIGGVATAEEMAEFLRHVDPDLESRLQDKISQFSIPDLKRPDLDAETGPMRAVPVPDATGTLERVASEPGFHDVSAATLTHRERTQTVVMGAAAASIGLGIGVLVMAVIGIAGFIAWQQSRVQADETVPIVVPVGVLPEVPAQPEPAPAPEPAEEPAPQTNPTQQTQRLRPTVDRPSTTQLVEDVTRDLAKDPPEPVPEAASAAEETPEVVEEPEPTPAATEQPLETVTSAPEPVETVRAPEPDTEAEPDPGPVAQGTLRVNARPVGSKVMLDGEVIGTTPFQGRVNVGSYVLSVEGHPSREVTISENLTKNETFK